MRWFFNIVGGTLLYGAIAVAFYGLFAFPSPPPIIGPPAPTDEQRCSQLGGVYLWTGGRWVCLDLREIPL